MVQLERAGGFAREDTVEEKLRKLRQLLAPATPGADEVEMLAELRTSSKLWRACNPF